MEESISLGIDVVVVVVLVVDVVIEVILVDVVIVESVMTVPGAIVSRKKNQNILKTE